LKKMRDIHLTRFETRKVIFGAAYGAGIFALVPVLEGLGAPVFYDKLLCVPILNLTVRALDRAEPALLIPALSAVATGVGLLWAFAPLLSGVALAETHDLTRLLSFPVPFRTLLASSLLANLLEPAALAKLPVVLAACLALAGPLWGRPIVFLLGLLGFVLMLAATQTAGLVLHALSRNRRFHDRALVLGISLGFLMSLLPFLFLYGGRSFRGAVKTILALDVFILSPWAWPVRGAVHASRGELLPTLLFGVLGLLALGSIVALNARVARRLYEGDLELAPARAAKAGKRPFTLPGAWGALLEKDLRLYWRDPRLKGMLITSVLSPILLLLLWRGAAGRPASGLLMFLAAFSGLGALGGNAFALERRGILLLFSFPVDRFEMLEARTWPRWRCGCRACSRWPPWPRSSRSRDGCCPCSPSPS
jgi:hypothetical protein